MRRRGWAILLGAAMLASCAAPGPPLLRGSSYYPPLDSGHPPLEFWELDHIARRVAAVCGRELAGPVRSNGNPKGPVASIQAIGGKDRITVNPRAAREIPPNAWAFIFGHEFAHQVHGFGHRGHTDPQQELRADILGARYAMDAGFSLETYLRWMLSRKPTSTESHGNLHTRARGLAKHYGITVTSRNRIPPRVPPPWVVR
jgi:hypothetical protein